MTASDMKITELPFVSTAREFGKDLWRVPVGTPLEQATGRQYADLAVAHARDESDPMILGAIMREIVRKKVLGPVEIGFMHRIGEHAMLSDSVVLRPASAPSEV